MAPTAFTCLSVYASACLSVYASVCLSVYAPTCLSVYASACLGMPLPRCLFIHVCLLMPLSASVSVPLGLPVSGCLSAFLLVFDDSGLAPWLHLTSHLSSLSLSLFISVGRNSIWTTLSSPWSSLWSLHLSAVLPIQLIDRMIEWLIGSVLIQEMRLCR